MIKKLIFCLLLSFLGIAGTETAEANRLRISLITCGPGYDAIYEVFGHSAVRIIDSDAHTDLAYNYGTFDGFQQNFELKFMRGQVMYCLSVARFDDFMEEYVQAKRSVNEQVLVLDSAQKMEVLKFLNWNALPENRNYLYDFFYDNCSTRIRDLFPNSFEKKFQYGKTLPNVPHYTFRDIINEYFYASIWARFGINILLGSRIDRVMSDKDIMFLPDYLLKGIASAQLNQHPIAPKNELLLPGGPAAPKPFNQAVLLTSCICILTVAGLSIPKLKVLGKIMSGLVLFVSGLLGCLILVMWFGTSHGGCRENFNLLWALPLNVIIAFANPKGKPKYALVAIVLIVVTFLLHLFRVQQVLLAEFSPFLLSLLFVYGSIYRKSRLKIAPNA